MYNLNVFKAQRLNATKYQRYMTFFYIIINSKYEIMVKFERNKKNLKTPQMEKTSSFGEILNAIIN